MFSGLSNVSEYTGSKSVFLSGLGVRCKMKKKTVHLDFNDKRTYQAASRLSLVYFNTLCQLFIIKLNASEEITCMDLNDKTMASLQTNEINFDNISA